MPGPSTTAAVQAERVPCSTSEHCPAAAAKPSGAVAGTDRVDTDTPTPARQAGALAGGIRNDSAGVERSSWPEAAVPSDVPTQPPADALAAPPPMPTGVSSGSCAFAAKALLSAAQQAAPRRPGSAAGDLLFSLGGFLDGPASDASTGGARTGSCCIGRSVSGGTCHTVGSLGAPNHTCMPSMHVHFFAPMPLRIHVIRLTFPPGLVRVSTRRGGANTAVVPTPPMLACSALTPRTCCSPRPLAFHGRPAPARRSDAHKWPGPDRPGHAHACRNAR